MKPLQAFHSSLEDARHLLLILGTLTNLRTRRVRKERRVALATALGFAKKRSDDLDCIESEHAFIVCLPGSPIGRTTFTENTLAPLLRQTLVATCAAIETYVADKTKSLIPRAFSLDELPSRLAKVALTIGDVMEVRSQYERVHWGYKALVQRHLEQIASPAPDQISVAFHTVGVKINWKAIDRRRNVNQGTSQETLRTLYARRNKIAHAADRTGSSRNTIDPSFVERMLLGAVQIVEAIDAHVDESTQVEA